MAFSDLVIKQAWARSKGLCECTRQCKEHTGQCPKPLHWHLRGFEGVGGWEAHHKTGQTLLTGDDTLDNCEILCQQCHKNTKSYGG